MLIKILRKCNNKNSNMEINYALDNIIYDAITWKINVYYVKYYSVSKLSFPCLLPSYLFPCLSIQR